MSTTFEKNARDVLAQRVRKRISDTRDLRHSDGTLKWKAAISRERFVTKRAPIHLVDQVFKQMVLEGRLFGRPIPLWEGPKMWRIRKPKLSNNQALPPA